MGAMSRPRYVVGETHGWLFPRTFRKVPGVTAFVCDTFYCHRVVAVYRSGDHAEGVLGSMNVAQARAFARAKAAEMNAHDAEECAA